MIIADDIDIDNVLIMIMITGPLLRVVESLNNNQKK